MAKQTGVVTYPTLVAFKGDTLISQQVGDQVQILDVLKPGTSHIARNAGSETPDDKYTIRKTNDASKTFWANSISSLVKGNVAVAYAAIPDGAEDTIEVEVAGLAAGVNYRVGVIQGLPEGTDLNVNRVKIVPGIDNEPDTTFLVLTLSNNSGATLMLPTPGAELKVNIYE